MNDTDKALLNPPRRVATLDDFPLAWLEQVRAIIKRDGHKLRAGFPACIEVSGPNGWQALNLPTNGCEFEGKHARDTILRRLIE